MKKYLALGLLAVSALIVTSCGSPAKAPEGEQPTKQEQETPIVEGKPVENSEAPSPEAGSPEQEKSDEVGVYPGMKAPELILMDRDNNEIKLSDYAGKIVFINFWATTCPYCVDEMPDLEELYQNHRDDTDFALLGVNMTKTWEKKGKDKIVEWVDEEGITFPTVYDVEGVEAEKWMAYSLPVTYVIDKDGRSLGALMGKTSLDTFEGVLKKVREKNQ